MAPESLKTRIPESMKLEPQRTCDLLRTPDGRVRAAVEPQRPDLLPN